jgi:hypothetical protein
MKKFRNIMFALTSLLLVSVCAMVVIDLVPDFQSLVDIGASGGTIFAYTLASVPKIGSNPGRPTGKNYNIIIFDWDDVSSLGDRDEGGIKITGNLVLNTAAYAIQIYATQSTIKISQNNEGDPDAKGFIQSLEFAHPGDNQALEEFLENKVNANLGAIVREKSSVSYMKLLGTSVEPLQFDVESMDDNENKKSIITLKSILRGPRIAHYYGDVPDLDSGSGSGGV